MVGLPQLKISTLMMLWVPVVVVVAVLISSIQHSHLVSSLVNLSLVNLSLANLSLVDPSLVMFLLSTFLSKPTGFGSCFQAVPDYEPHRRTAAQSLPSS